MIATQADTNNRPYATIATMVSKMRDSEIGGTVTVGQVLDLLTDGDNEAVAELRARQLGQVFTLGELQQKVEGSKTFAALREEQVLQDMTVGDVVKLVLEADELRDLRDYDFGLLGVTFGKLLKDISEADTAKPLLAKQLTHLTTVGDLLDAVDASGVMAQYADTQIDATFTLGQIIDLLANNGDVQANRDQEITVKTSLGKLLDIVGEDKVKTFLEERAAAASYTPDYEYNPGNVLDYWLQLLMFIFAFAALATITLEFIDKDKR